MIIPTYNREKTIERAVRSVLEQTYTDFELLVIDDGSTDGTESLIEKIIDERIRYIKLKENGGPSNARNAGVRLAEGEWVAFQDSDDFWYPDKLEKQLAYAETHPEYDLVYCSYRVFSGERSFTVPMEPYQDILEGKMACALLKQNSIGTPTILVKKDKFLETGGFRTDYRALEDWEFAVRFSKEHLIGFVPDVLMEAYLLNGGVSSDLGAYFESRCKMLADYRNILMEEKMLDEVMLDIFQKAQSKDVLEPVKVLTMKYLSEKQ